ncbi:acylphosphatase [Methanospirillum sp.]
MSDSDKKQYHICVKGKVQRVWFRDKIEDLADDLGLTGYVQNQSAKDVVIVVEGEDEIITHFVSSIRDFPPPVKIKSIDVYERPYSGTFSEFTIIRGEMMEELSERFDSAIYYLNNIDIKQDKMLEKQNTGIGLQIETLNEIKGVHKDFQQTFTEELIEIRGEIRELGTAMIQAGYLKKADVQ